MARTLQTILDEAKDLAHSVWSKTADAVAVLAGMAAVLVRVETEGESLRDQTFRQTASSEYLDLIGRERGKERLPYETQEEWRKRAVLEPKGTIDWVERRIEHELDSLGFTGYTVHVFHPRETDQYADTPTSMVGDDQYGDEYPVTVLVAIPPMAAVDVPDIPAADWSFADETFAQEDRYSRDRYIHTRIRKIVETARQAGSHLTLVWSTDDIDMAPVESVAYYAEMEVGLL